VSTDTPSCRLPMRQGQDRLLTSPLRYIYDTVPCGAKHGLSPCRRRPSFLRLVLRFSSFAVNTLFCPYYLSPLVVDDCPRLTSFVSTLPLLLHRIPSQTSSPALLPAPQTHHPFSSRLTAPSWPYFRSLTAQHRFPTARSSLQQRHNVRSSPFTRLHGQGAYRVDRWESSHGHPVQGR
jgi:hypothetical protein